RLKHHADRAMVQEEGVSALPHNHLEDSPTRRRTTLENETVQEEGQKEVRTTQTQ
ncbi:unnamed protein product, partial [marine sediment metagenome]